MKARDVTKTVQAPSRAHTWLLREMSTRGKLQFRTVTGPVSIPLTGREVKPCKQNCTDVLGYRKDKWLKLENDQLERQTPTRKRWGINVACRSRGTFHTSLLNAARALFLSYLCNSKLGHSDGLDKVDVTDDERRSDVS